MQKTGCHGLVSVLIAGPVVAVDAANQPGQLGVQLACETVSTENRPSFPLVAEGAIGPNSRRQRGYRA